MIVFQQKRRALMKQILTEKIPQYFTIQLNNPVLEKIGQHLLDWGMN